MKKSLKKILCSVLVFGMTCMLCRDSVLARTVANSTFGTSYNSVLSTCLYGSNTMYQVNLSGYEFNPSTNVYKKYNKSLSKTSSSGDVAIITHKSDSSYIFVAEHSQTKLTATFYSGMGSGSLYYYATAYVS